MILDSQGGRKHSLHPNRDTPLWQTSILMIVGFVVTTGNSPAPLCSAGFSEAPTSTCVLLLPFLQEREELLERAAQQLKWETSRGYSIFQLTQQIICSNSNG